MMRCLGLVVLLPLILLHLLLVCDVLLLELAQLIAVLWSTCLHVHLTSAFTSLIYVLRRLREYDLLSFSGWSHASSWT